MLNVVTFESALQVLFEDTRWRAPERDVLARQLLRVMAQMLRHKTGNEIVAVVVARMLAQRERLLGRRAGGFKQMRMQLLGQKFVGQTLVDQDAAGVGRCAQLPH